MRVLVCGSRHFNDYDLLKEILNAYNVTKIIHGAARGADTLAGRYGNEANIPVTEFPADWDTHGKRAGPIRNYRMLREGNPEMVVAFLAKDSKGTKHMIEIAEKAGVEVRIVEVR